MTDDQEPMAQSQPPTAAPERHVLHPCCRVRQEAFGLLFYDLRGPRLLFAETGDRLDAAALARGETVEEALRPLGEGARRAVGGLVTRLVEKGFLREQPVR